MAKIFLFDMVSLDGFFEGENHDLSWHNVDAEFNQYAIEQTKELGTLLFGRRTYELMSTYWPTDEARNDDPIVAELMNTKPKIVFSNTLKSLTPIPHWENTRLMNAVDVEEIQKLKDTSSSDLGIYGSNQLCVSLIKLGLVDEFRLMYAPVTIGKGTPLFFGMEGKNKLELINSRQFKNGNVLHVYKKTSNLSQ